VLFRLAADALVVLHLAFIVFVVAGGFLTWTWPRLAWIHVPVALYGAAIEFVGWICPLTPWEIALRRQAGLAGYEGGFIEHYVLPIIYPSELTPTLRLILGLSVLAANAAAYMGFVARRRRTR
jgi:uncharacterized membrane protein YhhN